MKRVGLIGWFLFVIALGAVLGNRSALAQGCNTSCGCGCQNNPRSKYTYHICTTPCSWCGGGADGGCETDYCNGTCGSGYISYCQYYPMCGSFPMCQNGNCA